MAERLFCRLQSLHWAFRLRAPFRMKIIALINAKAGSLASASNLDQTEHIREAFAAEKLTADVRAHQGHEIIHAAKAALRENPDIIVGGGGDGTISCVAGQLANSNVPLGVLPLGTLNHFARDLRISTNIEGAVKVIAAGHVS